MAESLPTLLPRATIDDDAVMLRPTIRHFGPPQGTGILPRPVRAALARTGGIISTRELRALDVDQVTVELYRHRGTLQVVRQGWYCTPATPAVVRLAWRFGGPLACVSALQFHTALAMTAPRVHAEHPPQEDRWRGPMSLGGVDEPLHVSLRSDSVSPPPPALLARRWCIPEPEEPVLHWSTHDHASGDRRAVSVETALRQSRQCPARGGKRVTAR